MSTSLTLTSPTEAENALSSLVMWANENFDAAVAGGVIDLVTTGIRALREQTQRADQSALDAIQAKSYAEELERQRDHIANELMHAVAAARMTHLREIIDDTAKTLGVTREQAVNLIKTLTGENEHILGDWYTKYPAADLARDITRAVRLEMLPLDADESLPALPDDFDPDSDEEEL